MSNRSRAALVGGTLALLVAAGTAAAFAGADDSRTAAPSATSISVRPTTSSPTSSNTTSSSETSTSSSTSSSETSSSAAVGGVTSDDAERIALGRVGGGRVVRTEREFEHGRWEWHVRIEGSGGRYDVRVDGETGTVRADDSGGRGGDDSGHQGRGGDDSGHGNSGGDDSGHRGRGGDDH